MAITRHELLKKRSKTKTNKYRGLAATFCYTKSPLLVGNSAAGDWPKLTFGPSEKHSTQNAFSSDFRSDHRA